MGLKFNHIYSGTRIQHRTVCTTKKQLDRYHAILKEVNKLYPEYIAAIKNNVYSIDYVVRMAIEEGVSNLAPLKKRIKLSKSLFKWLDTTIEPASKHTRDRYRRCLKNLLTIKPNATEVDLPILLQTYRERCASKGTFVEFRQTRAAVLSYIRQKYGKYSPLWRHVAAVPIFKHKSKRKPKHLKPVEAHQLAEALTPKCRVAFTSIITSGLRPSEYFDRRFTVHTNHILVSDSKTESSTRFIPRLLKDFPSRPPVSYHYFGLVLREYGFSVQDLRNTWLGWMEKAKIDQARQVYYAGHSSQHRGLTVYYQRGDEHGYLDSDAEALENYMLDERIENTMDEFWGDRLIKPATRQPTYKF